MCMSLAPCACAPLHVYATCMRPAPMQGAASLSDGQLEVMLHRRNVVDDARGVGENLNETLCGCRDCACAGLMARGTMRMLLGRTRGASRALRTHMQLLNDPPLLMFGALPGNQNVQSPTASAASDEAHQQTAEVHSLGQPTHQQPALTLSQLFPGLVPAWSALSLSQQKDHYQQEATANAGLPVDLTAPSVWGTGGLPANVHLLTLQLLTPSTLLVRLAHTYQVVAAPSFCAHCVSLRSLCMHHIVVQCLDGCMQGALHLYMHSVVRHAASACF